jgi:splicing factor U2AF subunit
VHHGNANKKKNTMSKLLGGDNPGLTALNTKLHITGFPNTHTKEMILKICEVFGKVRAVDLLKDPATGEFKGQVHVEYTDEIEAKKGHTGMMGLKVGEGILFVKRLQTIVTHSANLDGEVFKSLLDDQPTPCLMLRNIVHKDEVESRDDYKEIEDSVQEEMMRYGNCLRVHCPRPPMFGSAEQILGYGKVYVRFSNELESEKAK